MLEETRLRTSPAAFVPSFPQRRKPVDRGMIHFRRLTGWGLRADNDLLAAAQHGIPYHAHGKGSLTVVGGANYRGNHHRGLALAG